MYVQLIRRVFLLTKDHREHVKRNKHNCKSACRSSLNGLSLLSPSLYVPWTPSCFILACLASFSSRWTHASFGELKLCLTSMCIIATGWRVMGKIQFVTTLPLFMYDKHIYLNAQHSKQAEVQLLHVSSFSVQEMCLRVSRKYLGRNIKCGSLQAPCRSPFTEMEWKNSIDGAISYPSENPGLGFLLLIPSHPLSLHLPRLLRMYM